MKIVLALVGCILNCLISCSRSNVEKDLLLGTWEIWIKHDSDHYYRANESFSFFLNDSFHLYAYWIDNDDANHFNGHYKVIKNKIIYQIENHDMTGIDTFNIIHQQRDSMWIQKNNRKDTALMVHN